MEEDYSKGYTGANRGEVTNESEYLRGQRDRASGRGPSGMGAMDLARFEEANRLVGIEWGKNPNKALRSMLLPLVYLPVIGGLIGFGIAVVMGPNWFASPLGLALGVASVGFFLAGIILWGQLVGSIVAGKPTGRGLLVLAVLTIVLGYMIWSTAIGPFLRNIYG